MQNSEAVQFNVFAYRISVASVDSVIAGDEAVRFYDLKGNLVEKPVRGIYVTSDSVKVLVK